MSFFPKLLIFVGWMLIFREKILSSDAVMPFTTHVDSSGTCVAPKKEGAFRTPEPEPPSRNISGLDEILDLVLAEGGGNDNENDIHISRNFSNSVNPGLTLVLVLALPMNITKTELDTILDPFLNETKPGTDVDLDKKIIPRTARFFRDLEQLTSGGPAAANPPKVLFRSTMATPKIMAAVALCSTIMLSTVICS